MERQTHRENQRVLTWALLGNLEVAGSNPAPDIAAIFSSGATKSLWKTMEDMTKFSLQDDISSLVWKPKRRFMFI